MKAAVPTPTPAERALVRVLAPKILEFFRNAAGSPVSYLMNPLGDSDGLLAARRVSSLSLLGISGASPARSPCSGIPCVYEFASIDKRVLVIVCPQ